VTSDQIEYDSVFIGTGLISILEAIYQEKCGKKVLMIDENKDLGGAWLPLNIFGFEDVENAIHYFLPDSRGIQFMRENLKWNVESSKGKYKVFHPPVLGFRRIQYDTPWADFLELYSKNSNFFAIFKQLFKTLSNIFSGTRKSSTYVQGGAAEMLQKTRNLLATSQIEMRFSTTISDILIDPDRSDFVQLKTFQDSTEKIIRSRSVNISHGAKIKSIRTQSEFFDLKEKTYSRPAAHLLVTDKSTTKVFESIFVNHKLIKYAHDVTRYARPTSEAKADQKVFVLALQHEVTPYDGIFQDIFESLKNVQVLGPSATLDGHCWWDVYLPSLDDDTLNRLTKKFGNKVSILKTENFARGIGLYADRWATKIT
jgi:hypothetical protein